jgi:predicted ATPase with chaperone activity
MKHHPDRSHQSPAMPGREFALWTSHDATQRLADYLGKGRNQARCPHHTASSPHALLGAVRWSLPDGWRVQPGEALLAGAGVLMLQDLPEFKRSAIEMVARAWRNGYVRLQAVNTAGGGVDGVVELPVHCSVYATAQACPCGMRFRPNAPVCACSEPVMARWQARIDDAVRLFKGQEVAS